jgi:hypothetical protein
VYEYIYIDLGLGLGLGLHGMVLYEGVGTTSS